MNQSQYNQLFAFIWNIANDVLVYAFNKGDYKKVILPMMVLRRLDILLEPTHEDVLKQKKQLDASSIPEESQEQVLFGLTHYPFCNTPNDKFRTFKRAYREVHYWRNQENHSAYDIESEKLLSSLHATVALYLFTAMFTAPSLS